MPAYLAPVRFSRQPDGRPHIDLSGGGVHFGPPGSPEGFELRAVPEPVRNPRWIKVGESHDERIGHWWRRWLGNRLGITLRAPSAYRLFGEALLWHGDRAHRWGGILGHPSKARLQYELWIGGVLCWHVPILPLPSTQTFTETWPTAGSVTASQDQPWTMIVGSPSEVIGGVARPDRANEQQGAICDSVLDTSDQRHLATFHLANNAGGDNTCSVKVRYSAQTNQYFFRLTRENGVFQRLTRKTVAGVDTTFGNDATDPGGDATMELIVDGSSITSKIGGSTVHSATDGTPQLLTNFKGGIQMIATTTIADCTLDTHTIADVVAGGASLTPTVGAAVLTGELPGPVRGTILTPVTP